jgi:hypothetical protein
MRAGFTTDADVIMQRREVRPLTPPPEQAQ